MTEPTDRGARIDEMVEGVRIRFEQLRCEYGADVSAVLTTAVQVGYLCLAAEDILAELRLTRQKDAL